MGIDKVKTSKLMALILRHKPEDFAIKLDTEGWCLLDELVVALEEKLCVAIDMEEIVEIVKNDDKGRYSLSGDLSSGFKIRANQGHSTEDVTINFKQQKPPRFLFHGTNEKSYSKILKEGLKKMNRHHVHLTDDFMTAVRTGSRRGKPFVIVISSEDMDSNGRKFFKSENNVWLVDNVPVGYFVSTWSQKRIK